MKHKAKDKMTAPTSIVELSDALGVSRQLIVYHTRTGKAPRLDDLAGWHEYLAMHGRVGSAPSKLRDAIAKEKLGILKAVRADKERSNKMKDGEMVHHSTAQQFIHHLVGVIIFGELDRMLHEFPVTLNGRNEIQIYEEVQKQIQALKTTMRTKIDEWVAMGPKPEQEKGKA